MVSLGWVGPEPALCWDVRYCPQDPYTTFGTGFAHPNEAMNSIHALHLTAAASSEISAQSLTSRRSR